MERPILVTFLIGSLTLGFLAFFSAYLPTQLSQSKGSLAITSSPVATTQSLAEIVNAAPPPLKPPQQSEDPDLMPAMVLQTAQLDDDTANDAVNDNDNEGEGPFVATADSVAKPTARSVHRRDKWHKKAHKVTPSRPISQEESDQYPLRMYDPLEDAAPNRHHPYGLITPASIEPAVNFWRNVYANYSLDQTILHDNRYLDIVYGVLDFSDLDDNPDLNREEARRFRHALEDKKKKELAEMLLRFDQGDPPQTAGEHVVYNMFTDFSDPQKFSKAADRVRAQWGQKDRFEEGLIRSGRYLSLMEQIFTREGVPKDITRVVFVESMFNLDAYSKVGAAGPWQFMPGTAKLYMTMNHYVDERRDPLMAAQGAARLLLKNYELVHSWPMAINGYNTGILRMVKAMNRMQTKDIGEIINKFDDSGYQFASRNFYPEFLAALDVVNNYKSYFGELTLDNPVPFDSVVLTTPTSLSKLAQQTSTDIGLLQDLNPAYFDHCFSPKTVLPKGYTVHVPQEQRPVFLNAMNQIADQNKEPHWHVVSKGENIKQLADRYQVPVSLLKETNNLVGNGLKPGQILKIPSMPEKVVLKTPAE